MVGNSDMDLLEKTYQNATIGITALEAVLHKSTGVEFNNALHRQLEDYRKIVDKTKEQLKLNDVQVKDRPAYEKAMMKGNVKMNTLINSSDSHIAQMVIQGSTMGITQMTKLLNSKPNVDGASAQIAKDFIHKEQDNIEEMKKFL